MYKATHNAAKTAQATVPTNTHKLSGSFGTVGLTLVFSKSNMLLLGTMAKYKMSFKQRMNSNATEFKIKSEKLLVANSHLQPIHIKYVVMQNRGINTNIVSANFMGSVNLATTNGPPSISSSSSSDSAMVSHLCVCMTKDSNKSLHLRMSATQVNVHMYNTAEKNSGWDNGMRQASACASGSMVANAVGSKKPSKPRRSTNGDVENTKV
mmetsp:Transcript_53040/g.104682  ORF Transcript_53040/g.104682 Transcript_53040/m.104682 type:complete len:209 (+) Transcript_53040:109-735(+)